MNKPLVSILMNCYNGSEFLRDAIDSVYAQTYTDWEIIFWDNQSTDQSSRIAKSYDQKLKYFRSSEFTTLYKARNLAIEKACGRFIAILDCDDRWLPEKLQKQIPLFEDEDVGAVFSDTLYFSENGKWRLYGTKSYTTGYCFKELFKNNFMASPSIIYRKSAIDKLDHVFDDRFNMSGDWDLALRISLGWKLACCPDVLVEYRLHDNNLSKKMPESIVKEAGQMIEKYSNYIEGFREKYADSIRGLEKERDMVLASIYWSKGNAKESRKILKNHLGSIEELIKYFATFLKFDRFERLKMKLKTIRNMIS